MNKKALVPIGMVAVAAAAVALYFALRPRRDSGALELSGNIELTAVELSFKSPGWVKERPVDEGQAVKAGQLVARLDDVEVQRELARQEALVASARANLAELEHGSRPEEIRQGEAALASARADLERQEAEFARQRELFSREVISQREFDAAKSAFEMAEARERQALESLVLLKKGPRTEKVEAGRAALAQAEASLAITRRQMENTVLLSPVDGTVLAKNTEAGEYVSPGTPIVTVGNLEKVWLRAYVEETDLGRVKLGQRARVATDTFPGKVYEGAVSFIASDAEFTPKSVQTRKERVKLVYRIKIDVANPAHELKPGMPADATIETGIVP
jgi:HlyD family secretion protein